MTIRISFKSNIHTDQPNYVEGNNLMDALYELEKLFRSISESNKNIVNITDFKVQLNK